jgi:hypothetical protein
MSDTQGNNDQNQSASSTQETTQTTSSSSQAETNDPFAEIADPALKSYIEGAGHKSLESLAADAMSANQMIGAKAGGGNVVQVPSVERAADPQAWAAFDKASGVPDDGQYSEFKPETGNLLLSSDQLSTLDKNLHAVGATPSMRDAALKSYHEMAATAQEAEDKAWNTEVTAGNTKLKAEWGDDFDKNIKLADRAMEDNFGEDFAKLMKDGQFNEHPILRAAGFKLAMLTAEAGPPPAGDKRQTGAMTKAEAETELAKIESSQAFLAGDPAAAARRVQLTTILAG